MITDILNEINTTELFDNSVSYHTKRSYFWTSHQKQMKSLRNVSGVYAVYDSCIRNFIYVGASKNLHARVIRFTSRASSYESFYLRAVLNELKSSEYGLNKLTVYYKLFPLNEIAQKEVEYIQKLIPIFNFSRAKYRDRTVKPIAEAL